MYVGVCISVHMIVYMCVCNMQISTIIIKLIDVLLIYKFSTYIPGIMFESYTPLSIFQVCIIVPLTIWSYINPTSIAATQLNLKVILISKPLVDLYHAIFML